MPRRVRKILWTSEEARALIQRLLPPLKSAGFYPALTGSVLWNEHSYNDLDLMVYPETRQTDYDYRDPEHWEPVRAALREAGLHRVRSVETIHKFWRNRGSVDSKLVEVWADKQARRIDVFLVS